MVSVVWTQITNGREENKWTDAMITKEDLKILEYVFLYSAFTVILFLWIFFRYIYLDAFFFLLHTTATLPYTLSVSNNKIDG